jgi:hypothetical protein
MNPSISGIQTIITMLHKQLQWREHKIRHSHRFASTSDADFSELIAFMDDSHTRVALAVNGANEGEGEGEERVGVQGYQLNAGDEGWILTTSSPYPHHHSYIHGHGTAMGKAGCSAGSGEGEGEGGSGSGCGLLLDEVVGVDGDLLESRHPIPLSSISSSIIITDERYLFAENRHTIHMLPFPLPPSNSLLNDMRNNNNQFHIIQTSPSLNNASSSSSAPSSSSSSASSSPSLPPISDAAVPVSTVGHMLINMN